MSHFPSGTRGELSVEVQLYIRKRRRRAASPVPFSVHKSPSRFAMAAGTQQVRRAEREAAHRAKLLLELAG
jgi:hypothetical protein